MSVQNGERRALTVFYRPIGQGIADRTTGRAETSAAMAAEMRRKVGRVERARERRAGRIVTVINVHNPPNVHGPAASLDLS